MSACGLKTVHPFLTAIVPSPCCQASLLVGVMAPVALGSGIPEILMILNGIKVHPRGGQCLLNQRPRSNITTCHRCSHTCNRDCRYQMVCASKRSSLKWEASSSPWLVCRHTRTGNQGQQSVKHSVHGLYGRKIASLRGVCSLFVEATTRIPHNLSPESTKSKPSQHQASDCPNRNSPHPGGMPVGREGPMIHAAAIMAAGVSQGMSTTIPGQSSDMPLLHT